MVRVKSDWSQGDHTTYTVALVTMMRAFQGGSDGDTEMITLQTVDGDSFVFETGKGAAKVLRKHASAKQLPSRTFREEFEFELVSLAAHGSTVSIYLSLTVVREYLHFRNHH